MRPSFFLANFQISSIRMNWRLWQLNRIRVMLRLLPQVGDPEPKWANRCHFSNLCGLLDISHRKQINPTLHKSCGGGEDSMPICICLDYGNISNPIRKGLPNESNISFKCGKIDLGPASISFHVFFCVFKNSY